MRTPKEIRTDLRVLDRQHKREEDKLLSELSQSQTGFQVGDTIQSRQDEYQSIIITEVSDTAIKGSYSDTEYSMPIREARMWRKV